MIFDDLRHLFSGHKTTTLTRRRHGHVPSPTAKFRSGHAETVRPILMSPGYANVGPTSPGLNARVKRQGPIMSSWWRMYMVLSAGVQSDIYYNFLHESRNRIIYHRDRCLVSHLERYLVVHHLRVLFFMRQTSAFFTRYPLTSAFLILLISSRHTRSRSLMFPIPSLAYVAPLHRANQVDLL